MKLMQEPEATDADFAQLHSTLQPLRLNHLGVAVRSIAGALPLHTEVLGQTVVSGPFEDPIQKVRVCFLSAGATHDVPIELVEPLGADSPIVKMLAKGVAGYHLCYEVADLDAALAAISARRWVIVSKPAPAVAFGGRRIAWFYTPSQELIELLETEV